MRTKRCQKEMREECLNNRWFWMILMWKWVKQMFFSGSLGTCDTCKISSCNFAVHPPADTPLRFSNMWLTSPLRKASAEVQQEGNVELWYYDPKSRWHFFTVTQALCSKVLVSRALWKLRAMQKIKSRCSIHKSSAQKEMFGARVGCRRTIRHTIWG